MAFLHRHACAWTLPQVFGLFVCVLSLFAIGITKSLNLDDKHLFTISLVTEGIVCFIGVLLIFIPLFHTVARQ